MAAAIPHFENTVISDVTLQSPARSLHVHAPVTSMLARSLHVHAPVMSMLLLHACTRMCVLVHELGAGGAPCTLTNDGHLSVFRSQA